MPNISDIIPLLDNIPREPILAAAFVLLLTIAFVIYQNIVAHQPENILTQTQLKSYDMLQNAMKKGQDLIAQAELESLKVAATTKLQTRDVEESYMIEVKQAIKESEQAVHEAQTQFNAYLEKLGIQAGSNVSQNEEVLKQQVNKIFESFEQNLSSFLTQTQAQSTQAIALEMQAARQLIETYKQQQFRLIDENIVAMLERTLSLVLLKKLTLKDHIDLVYESLEKAKAEKFII